MNVGDTFLRPAHPMPGEKQHLWIIITSPNPENQVLIVNITSLKPWQDQTVILNSGEHPFITQQSCVFYREAEIVDNSRLDEAEEKGAIVKRESCSERLIALIRDGLAASPHTKRGVKRFFDNFR